jgi:glycosyltransferase involved in cell wall biosynthesis
MAAGVPIIADNRGGWRELIQHGETGLLCDSSAEAAAAIVELANEEGFRMKLIDNARKSMATLADPQAIGASWVRIFRNLSELPL